MQKLMSGRHHHTLRERLFVWLMAFTMLVGQGNWTALSEGEENPVGLIAETAVQPEDNAGDGEQDASADGMTGTQSETPDASDADVPDTQPETPDASDADAPDAQPETPDASDADAPDTQPEIPDASDATLSDAQPETPDASDAALPDAQPETPDEPDAGENDRSAGSATAEAADPVLWRGLARVTLAEDEESTPLYEDAKTETAKGTLSAGAVVQAVRTAGEDRCYVSFWADGEPWFGYVSASVLEQLTEEEAALFAEEGEALLVIDRRDRTFYDMTPYFVRNAERYPKAQPAKAEEPAAAATEETGEDTAAEAGTAEAAVMTEEAEDSTQESVEPAVEESVEAEVDEAIPQYYIDLTSFTDRCNATIDPPPAPGTRYDHDDTLTIKIDFHIDETKKPLNRLWWAYDLSELIGDDKPLDGVSGSGNIRSGAKVYGVYTVVDGVVLITITDFQWYMINRNINGTFNFMIALNGENNLEKNEETIRFPGGSTIRVPLKETDLDSSKTVQNTAYASPDSSHEMKVIDNGDGTYTLCYTLTATPNQNGGTLTLTDTLSGGQKLVPGSVTVKPATANSTVASDDSGLNLTVSNPEKDTQYTVTYRTTITGDQLRSNQGNTATWNWAGKSFTDSTDVIPTADDRLSVKKQSFSQAGATWNQNITAQIDANASTTTNYTDTQSYNGTYNVTPNADGTYTVYYQVEATAGSNLGTISLTDTMSGGQIYNNDAQLTVNGSAVGAVTPNGNGFTASFSNVKEYDWISVSYSATYTADQLDQLQSNTARWEWVGEPITLTTEFTPTQDRRVTAGKTVAAEDGTQPKNNKLSLTPTEDGKYTLTYTITFSSASDQAALLLTDTLANSQSFVPGSFVLKAMNGGSEVSSQNISPVIDGSRFTYELNGVSKDYQYVLTYDVVFEVPNGQSLENGIWTGNNIEFSSDGTTVGQTSVNVQVGAEAFS